MVAVVNCLTHLHEYPSQELRDASQAALAGKANPTISMGDMHGNALNFLHKLIAFGVVEMSEADYTRFVELYAILVEDPSNQEAIAECRDIIDLLVVHPDASLDLIGDLLGDRGVNDILTLLLLKKLTDNGLRYEINISNHGAGFIHEFLHFLRRERSSDPDTFPGEGGRAMINRAGQMLSSNALFDLMSQDDATREEVVRLYKECYESHLVLFGVQYDAATQALTVTAHAPITMMSVFSAARVFQLSEEAITAAEHSTEAFIQLLSDINRAFRQQLIDGTLVQPEGALNDVAMNAVLAWGYNISSDPDAVLVQSIWSKKIVPDELKPHAEFVARLKESMSLTEIAFVHGHTGPAYRGPDGHHNIDTNLGKLAHLPQGDCVCSVAGPSQTIPEPLVLAGKSALERAKEVGNQRRAETMLARAISASWVGAAGLVVAAVGACGCGMFLPNIIIHAGVALSSSPLALAFVIALAVGVAALALGGVGLIATRHRPVFFRQRPSKLPAPAKPSSTTAEL